MDKERAEARIRFEKAFNDEKHKKGKEPLHDSPEPNHAEKPPKNWKQDKGGKWYLAGWKFDVDTWIEDGD